MFHFIFCAVYSFRAIFILGYDINLSFYRFLIAIFYSFLEVMCFVLLTFCFLPLNTLSLLASVFLCCSSATHFFVSSVACNFLHLYYSWCYIWADKNTSYSFSSFFFFWINSYASCGSSVAWYFSSISWIISS